MRMHCTHPVRMLALCACAWYLSAANNHNRRLHKQHKQIQELLSASACIDVYVLCCTVLAFGAKVMSAKRVPLQCTSRWKGLQSQP